MFVVLPLWVRVYAHKGSTPKLAPTVHLAQRVSIKSTLPYPRLVGRDKEARKTRKFKAFLGESRLGQGFFRRKT